MGKELKQPKNFRRVMPRVCATCRFAEWDTFFNERFGVIMDTGWMQCTRDESVGFDGGDMEQWFHTCDRWQDENGGKS